MGNLRPLLELALTMRERAHAPYSGYRVGAAIRDDRDRLFGGCNVENAAYPQSLCAEAAAIAALVAGGGGRVQEVCIVGTGARLAVPCGGCRQRLLEFADGTACVHVANEQGAGVQSFALGALLPNAFGPEGAR